MMEDNLRQERNLVSRIMDTSPVSITMVNKNGHTIYANKRAELLFNLKKDDILNRMYNESAWKITDYEGNPLPDDNLPFELVRKTGKPVEDINHAIEDPNGNRILLSINASPLFDDTGNFDGMVTIIEDVTQKIEAERKVKRSDARYRELFDRMLSGFALHEIITNKDGKPVDYIFLEANEAFEKMTNLSRTDIIGKKVTEAIPNIHESSVRLDRRIRQGCAKRKSCSI